MIFVKQHYYFVKIYDNYHIVVYEEDLGSYWKHSRGLCGFGYITFSNDNATHASFTANNVPEFIQVYGEIADTHINIPISQLHEFYPEYFI